MYLPCYIITYNVYFLTHNVTFLDERHMCFSRDRRQKCHFLSEGKKVIVILKHQIPTLISPVDHSSLLLVLDLKVETLEAEEN